MIVRMDVHCEYAPDYVENCVDVLERTGADNVGGSPRCRGESPFQKAVCAALRSPLGAGGAPQWNPNNEGFVHSVPFGALRREKSSCPSAASTARAVTNEDAELNQRLIAAGRRVYLSPDIVFSYFPRASVGGLVRQYFRYGQGRARTLVKHRQLLNPRPALPFGAVVVALVTAALAPRAALGLGSLYAVATLVEALRVGWRDGWCVSLLVWLDLPDHARRSRRRLRGRTPALLARAGLVESAPVRAAVILMYHRLGEGRLAEREPGEHLYAVAPDVFEAQLDVVRELRVLDALARRGLRRDEPFHRTKPGVDHLRRRQHVGPFRGPARTCTSAAACGLLRHARLGRSPRLHGLGRDPRARGRGHDGGRPRSRTRPALGPLPRGPSQAADGSAARNAGPALTSPGVAGSALVASAAVARSRSPARRAFRTSWAPCRGSREVRHREPIPRFAIRRGQSLASFRALVEQRRTVRLRYWLRHQALSALRLLGPKTHARLRAVWVTSRD